MNEALILIDIQNDFLPGGSLAVPHGDEVISIANRLLPEFSHVIATQDWHPPDHGSFATQHPGHSVGDVVDLDGLQQILWPDHCVQGSHGACFADELNVRTEGSLLAHPNGSQRGRFFVFPKGTDRNVDSYSGFFDNGQRKSTGLAEHLQASGITHVYLLGLATDYCVKFTAFDALRTGFSTTLILDGCRGVDLQPGDSAAAVEEMQAAGVRVQDHRQLLSARSVDP